jgi:hypothetical protein
MVRGSVRQIFVEDKMMIEARWPNMSLDDLWNRNRWARAGKGSRYGKMVDPNLAKTGIDWTGAIAHLNVAHQFYTWTRTVTNHEPGSNTFNYAANLQTITNYADKERPWEDDRYCLTGKLEALDTEGEWFHDEETGTLYMWAPGGVDPGSLRIETKARDFAFSGAETSFLRLAGFEFFACTFELNNADGSVIEDCHVRYPNWARRLYDDPEAVDSDQAATRLSGNSITIRDCSFAWGPTKGLQVDGRRNVVEDCLFHDFCWNGSLRDPVVSIHSQGEEPAEDRCIVRHCTLLNAGNAIINYRGLPGHIIEYNHVYNGGLCCKDVALVYTGSPKTAGSIVRYNWVHGCHTESVNRKGLHGGLGIRGDDQTRSLTVHHNVVWDCGRDGIIVKGDFNRVFNNTVFDIGTKANPGNYINMHTEPEPEKWWRNQHPLLEVQNANSRIANNAALTITRQNNGKPYEFEKNLSHNYREPDLPLLDIDNYDFRPKAGSPLVDGGEHIPGFTDGYKGKAPDIGAYEQGGKHWIPGITWDPDKVLGYSPKGYIKKP